MIISLMEGKTFTSLVARLRETVSDVTAIVRGQTLVSAVSHLYFLRLERVHAQNQLEREIAIQDAMLKGRSIVDETSISLLRFNGELGLVTTQVR